MISPRRLTGFATYAACAAVAFPSLAFADVKLMQTVTTRNNAPQAGGRGNQTVNITAYYKGNKVRQDTPQGIILMDGDSRQMYTINSAQKTYQVTPLGSGPQMPFMDMMQFDTKMTITPTGRTKTIVGKVAKGYTYNATIKIGMSAKGQQMMKAQGGGAPNTAAMFPTFRLSGETWATDTIPVSAVGAQAAATLLRGIPGMEQFAKKMGSIKGLPLESTTNMTIQGGAMRQGGAQPVQASSRTITTQLSQAALPASLFTVPAGYKKVAAQMPGMGGMRRPGAARPPVNR